MTAPGPEDVPEDPATVYVPPRVAADLLNIGAATLARWARENKLTCITTPGGTRRYPLTEIHRLRAEQVQAGEFERTVADDAVRLYDDGLSIATLADKFECTYDVMHRIVRTRTRLRGPGWQKGRQESHHAGQMVVLHNDGADDSPAALFIPPTPPPRERQDAAAPPVITSFTSPPPLPVGDGGLPLTLSARGHRALDTIVAATGDDADSTVNRALILLARLISETAAREPDAEPGAVVVHLTGRDDPGSTERLEFF